jgi:hypothetical protein
MMKRTLIGLTAALALLAGIWSVSAATDFSGTWSLDKSKSKGLPRQMDNIESYTMVVTQDEKQLTVENKITAGARMGGDRGGSGGQGGRPEGGVGGQGSGRRQGGFGQGGGRGGRGGFGMGMGTATYKLDGSETKIESAGGRSGAAALSAKWKDGGKSLELTNTRSMNFQGNEVTRTTKERWELADDGKTLKVKRSVEGPQGSQESTLVFVRQ